MQMEFERTKKVLETTMVKIPKTCCLGYSYSETITKRIGTLNRGYKETLLSVI